MHYYGYHTKGPSLHYFDEDWMNNKYFLSSQETAFDLQLLVRYDVQLLIGQVSYKQTAEIYNAVHGYNVKKQCSSTGDSKDDSSSEDDT